MEANLNLEDRSKSGSAKSKLKSSTADTARKHAVPKESSDHGDDPDASQHNAKLTRGWRRKLAAPPRWTRMSLAELWGKSERQVDRMRKAGLLGEPIGRIGKTDIYSDEQRLAAERAGLKAHKAGGET